MISIPAISRIERRTQAFTDGQGCRWQHPDGAARCRAYEKVTPDGPRDPRPGKPGRLPSVTRILDPRTGSRVRAAI